MWKYALYMSTAVVYAGCTPVSVEPHDMVKNAKPSEHVYGGGVLVAETSLEAPHTSRYDLRDCVETPLKVSVKSTTADHAELYEAASAPCSDKAEVLFDGKTPLGNRAADPTIQIAFQDFEGAPREEVASGKAENIVIAMEGDAAVLPSDFALQPGSQASKVEIARREADEFTETMSNWREKRERELLLKESEKLLADVRGMSRMNDGAIIAEHQKEIQRLLAKLRDVEKSKELKQQRNEQALAALDMTRKEAEAIRRQQEQEHSHMRSKLEEQAARILELERQKQALDSQMTRKQEMYTKQLERLSADLRVAEAMADKGRQELVLEAASKIAEAERLAFAAKMQEKASMEREADRLRDEADSLMARAHTLSGGRQIVIPGLTPLSETVFNRASTKTLTGTTALINEWTDLPLMDRDGRLRLEDIELAIYEKDKTIPEILQSVFSAINQRAPEWTVQFEIPDGQKYILDEKWTIAAEARLDELLGYVARRVEAEHGLELAFQQFDGAKMLLVGLW